jgi:S1-C subfamily serine protease
MRHRLVPAVLALASLAACEAPQRPLPPSTRPVIIAPPAQAAPAPRASALLERLGMAVKATPGGLLVTALDLDGAAAQGGARVGDLLLGINGETTRTAAELERVLARAGAAELTLEVVRGGQPQRVAVAAASPGAAWNPLGLQVRELPRETLAALDLSYGLMVSKIRAPANRTRLLPGDVIVAVDQKRFRSVEEFDRLVAAHRAGALGLVVRRTDSDLFIAIDPAGEDAGASGGASAPRPPHGALRTRLARGKPLRI